MFIIHSHYAFLTQTHTKVSPRNERFLCLQEGVDYDGSASSGAEDVALPNKTEEGPAESNSHAVDGILLLDNTLLYLSLNGKKHTYLFLTS